MKIRILSYNIHKGFNGLGNQLMIHHLREALRETAVDVLMLQEVVGENIQAKTKHKDWPSQPQFEFLADTVWEHYSYGKNAVFSGRHHGNAILSKFPILNYHNLNISTHKLEQRGLLHCQIQIPETAQTLNLLNTHLDLLAMNRRKQIEKISQYIRSKLKPEDSLLMAGDFNDWPCEMNAIVHDRIQAREVFTELHGKPAQTFPHFFPFLRLDRIYSRGIKPLSAKVLNTPRWAKISDHLPLLAEFEIS